MFLLGKKDRLRQFHPLFFPTRKYDFIIVKYQMKCPETKPSVWSHLVSPNQETIHFSKNVQVLFSMHRIILNNAIHLPFLGCQLTTFINLELGPHHFFAQLELNNLMGKSESKWPATFKHEVWSPKKWVAVAFHASWHIFTFLLGIEPQTTAAVVFQPCSVEKQSMLTVPVSSPKTCSRTPPLNYNPLECFCWTFSIIESLNKNRVGIIHRLQPQIQTPKSNDIKHFHHPNHFHHLISIILGKLDEFPKPDFIWKKILPSFSPGPFRVTSHPPTQKLPRNHPESAPISNEIRSFGVFILPSYRGTWTCIVRFRGSPNHQPVLSVQNS